MVFVTCGLCSEQLTYKTSVYSYVYAENFEGSKSCKMTNVSVSSHFTELLTIWDTLGTDSSDEF